MPWLPPHGSLQGKHLCCQTTFLMHSGQQVRASAAAPGGEVPQVVGVLRPVTEHQQASIMSQLPCWNCCIFMVPMHGIPNARTWQPRLHFSTVFGLSGAC